MARLKTLTKKYIEYEVFLHYPEALDVIQSDFFSPLFYEF